MSHPRITFSDSPSTTSDVDIIVVGARRTDDRVVIVGDPAYAGLAELADALGITGAAEQVVRTADTVGAAKAIAVVGLGKATGADALRVAAGAASRQLTGVESIGFAFGTTDADDAVSIAEGAALGAYAFTEYRQSSLSAAKKPVSAVTVHTSVLPSESEQQRVGVVADAVNLVRDLVNTAPAELYPESFAERVHAEVDGLGFTVTEWDSAQLAADGFGGILGVGKGSVRPPRLVKVDYSPEGAAQHLAIVGKGITFDTGGLSLKPMVSMIGMKSDMAGAAVALAVTIAAARLAVPLRITAWLCLAENMPSGEAVRPNDVLRIRGGRTVEVVNTDAEGRLVLADGLVAASEEQPTAIIDVATLTGAQVVALGHRYSGVMGDEHIVETVLTAAKEAGEQFWPMPLPEELLPRLDSDVADLKNATPGDTAAGMLLAGVFLREFIGTRVDGGDRIPWAHLDIAGAALNEGKPYGHVGAGGTGVAVRTLIRLAESHRGA